MITPVLFYWAHLKGWDWAGDLWDALGPGNELRHQEEGIIPLPEGLILTHITLQDQTQPYIQRETRYTGIHWDPVARVTRRVRDHHTFNAANKR